MTLGESSVRPSGLNILVSGVSISIWLLRGMQHGVAISLRISIFHSDPTANLADIAITNPEARTPERTQENIRMDAIYTMSKQN